MEELKLDTRDNPLLRRKEIELVVRADVTPSKDEAAGYIGARLGVDKELVVIRSIEGKYGVQEFLIKAKVYQTKDDLELVEGKQKAKSGAEGEQGTQGEAGGEGNGGTAEASESGGEAQAGDGEGDKSEENKEGNS